MQCGTPILSAWHGKRSYVCLLFKLYFFIFYCSYFAFKILHVHFYAADIKNQVVHPVWHEAAVNAKFSIFEKIYTCFFPPYTCLKRYKSIYKNITSLAFCTSFFYSKLEGFWFPPYPTIGPAHMVQTSPLFRTNLTPSCSQTLAHFPLQDY